MRRKASWTTIGLLVLAVSAVAADSVPGVPVSVLVTAESKQANEATLAANDLTIKEAGQNRAVSGVRHLGTGNSQILFLIDDSAGGSFDTQIPEVKKFISSLPAGDEVAIGYMHNGTSTMTSQFTTDHAKAAASVRLPLGLGGADVSPYDSLSDAVKKWPQKAGFDRREVIMISSGVEGLGGGLPPENPYVNAGIEAAQKAGVVVYAIYNPLAGHAGHSFWRANWGQNFLSQLADATGGELYMVGFGSAVTFQPYFEDILKRQNDQYIVTFEAGASKKSELEPLKISSTRHGLSIAAPDKVYVKASM